jgi:16S rRNA (guanine966-N2)-methyltransferase
MRVIGGSARGKKLLPVPGDTTRPILDRVKTALFDILRPRLAGARVLDLFAGTGAIGIEALSQGAARCVFVDLEANAVATAKKNIEGTRFQDAAQVFHKDAFSYIKQAKEAFDIIFIAPPQYKALWIEAMQRIAERPHLLTENGVIIVQIDPIEYEPLTLSEFHENDQRVYGKTALVFYKKGAKPV